MEQHDIDDPLRRHRRRTWWPFLCRCGLPRPCGARVIALDEQVRAYSRARGEWYVTYFAEQRVSGDRQR